MDRISKDSVSRFLSFLEVRDPSYFKTFNQQERRDIDTLIHTISVKALDPTHITSALKNMQNRVSSTPSNPARSGLLTRIWKGFLNMIGWRISSASLFDKIQKRKQDFLKLKKALVTDAPRDQKDLLSVVSQSELEAIYACHNHPDMQTIVDYVKTGEWENLIQLAKQQKDLPVFSILKAAFCQGKLGDRDPNYEAIDNLVSAYIFLGPAMADQAYEIWSFENVAKNPLIWGKEIIQRWTDIEKVPPNQRFFILVKVDELPDHKWLMHSFHEPDRSHKVVGSICFQEYQGWALGSAGLIRTDSELAGHPPIYGRALRSFTSRFCHLLEGRVDIALYEPSDQKPKHVHGRKPGGNFLTTHDCFHAFMAVRSDIFNRQLLLKLGQKINHLLTQIPPYSQNVKLVTDRSPYAFLGMKDKTEAGPTEGDWARFYFTEVIKQIQDGEISYEDPLPPLREVRCQLLGVWDRQVKAGCIYKGNVTVAKPCPHGEIPLLLAEQLGYRP